MRRIRDLLRLRHENGLSTRLIATALGISKGAVGGYGASRAELFASVDAPALKPLPPEPYAFAVSKLCRVAPGHKACRDGRSVFYQRVPRLFEALALARGDGRHSRLLKTLARIDLLILDDWGLAVLSQAQRIDLLEILEDRSGCGSTIVTSQVPVDQ